MSTDQAIAFVLFAFVAAITPGPSNLILTSTGATVGVRRGLPTLFGVTLGMGVMMGLVALGLGGVILAYPLLLQGVRWLGVAFLLWLAWKIATSGPSEAAAGRGAVGLWRAAAFQWVNPKSWLVAASATATYLQASEGALAQSLAFGLLFVAAALPSCFVWLAFGAGLQRLLRTERALRAFNLTMAALLAGSVLLIIW